MIHQKFKDENKRREAFYNSIKEGQKTEFINGEIVVHPPARFSHWITSGKISASLFSYAKERGLGVVGVEKVMIRLTRNDYEPDIVFFCTDKSQTLYT
jgi:Uma2 family endonuclease